MAPTFIITGIGVLIAFLLMAVKVLFVKGGKFPNTHIAGNKEMKKRGIGCAKSMDRESQQKKSLLDMMDEN